MRERMKRKLENRKNRTVVEKVIDPKAEALALKNMEELIFSTGETVEKSKKKKKKKKKNPDEIEWCVRVHMIELTDVPDAPAFGMMNTFVTFEMNTRKV